MCNPSHNADFGYLTFDPMKSLVTQALQPMTRHIPTKSIDINCHLNLHKFILSGCQRANTKATILQRQCVDAEARPPPLLDLLKEDELPLSG